MGLGLLLVCFGVIKEEVRASRSSRSVKSSRSEKSSRYNRKRASGSSPHAVRASHGAELKCVRHGAHGQ